MERDGYSKSLWQQNTLPYSTQESALNEPIDTVIVGGGITGITTGLLLQKAGKKCVVVEARNLGFGTTGGTTAHLNTFLDTPYYQIESDFGAENAQLVAQLTRNCIELIKRNIDEYKIDCGYKEAKGYIFSKNENETKELEKILESAQKVGLECGYSALIPAPIRYQKAIVFEGQAQFHPIKYLYGIADAFEKAGGTIIQDCRVYETTDNDGIAQVETGKGIITARKVVYATHIPPGVNQLHFQCAPYRSYAITVKLKDSNYPEGLVYDLEDPYHYYRTQVVDNEAYLIAGGEDHKTAHDDNTILRFAKLKSHISSYYNIDKVVHEWSSQYFEPADGLPFIGHLPGNPGNVYVATGFSGNGMIYGTASAMILSQLITTGDSDYKNLFNPERIKPKAGLGNIIKESVDVISKFAGQVFMPEKVEGLVELAKNEGKLIKYEGLAIAAYKDEAGRVFALDPHCPHIKCSVEWNSAEKSWDCPCHGSRFSFKGSMLTGPARKDLQEITLKESS